MPEGGGNGGDSSKKTSFCIKVAKTSLCNRSLSNRLFEKGYLSSTKSALQVKPRAIT